MADHDQTDIQPLDDDALEEVAGGSSGNCCSCSNCSVKPVETVEPLPSDGTIYA